MRGSQPFADNEDKDLEKYVKALRTLLQWREAPADRGRRAAGLPHGQGYDHTVGLSAVGCVRGGLCPRWFVSAVVCVGGGLCPRKFLSA